MQKKSNIVLWLDDLRDPFDKDKNWIKYLPINENDEIIWVKNYEEFVNYIQINGLPKMICFDHDLGLETKSGYECVLWVTNYCTENNLNLPMTHIQSANPVGKKNIQRAIENFMKNSDYKF